MFDPEPSRDQSVGWCGFGMECRVTRTAQTGRQTGWKNRIKRNALALSCAVVGLTLGVSSSAQAQDNCALIRSELASLHNGGGGGNAQLQQSISQQSREMARAEGAYDRYQCAFGAAPQCSSIVATLNQMQANLDTLQRQLSRAGGGSNLGRVAELERAFATQCGPGQRQQTPQADNLLAAIFGIRSEPDHQRRDFDRSAAVRPEEPYGRGFDRPGERVLEPGFRMRGNTYRTMCVRTSDGFYWPISFSTTRERFDEDRGLCAAMCPGTQVELYAYRNPGERVEAMINTLTGERYTEASYAFAYREAFDPNNRCTPSASVLDELRVAGGLQTGPEVASVPQPSPRPDMASDPETRALEDGGVSFSELGTMTRPEGEGEQMVRVVGPNYGYFAN